MRSLAASGGVLVAIAAALKVAGRENVLPGEQVLHPICGVAPQFGNHMGVGVHGHGDLRVPEDVHDHPRRDALDHEERRARVPKVVEAPLWQPSLIQVPVEVPGDSGSLQRLPFWSCEDKIVASD